MNNNHSNTTEKKTKQSGGKQVKIIIERHYSGDREAGEIFETVIAGQIKKSLEN